jgi:aquaporin related protein
MVAVLGEFIGTTIFLFFAFAGAQNAGIGGTVVNAQSLMYISLSFGLSLIINAWIFYRISESSQKLLLSVISQLQVKLALTLTKSITPVRAVLIFIAEIGGACFAAYLVKIMFPIPLAIQTKLAAGTTTAQGLFIEVMCTAELVFTILMLAAEKHKATFIVPLGIGLALFIAELTAVYYTGGSLYPARSFGPATVAHDFPGIHWIYWVSPFLGSLLATFFYWLFIVLEYEMANQGQDGDEENDPTQNPDHEVAQADREQSMEVDEIQNNEQNAGDAGDRSDDTPPNVPSKDDERNTSHHRASRREKMPAERVRSREQDQHRRNK